LRPLPRERVALSFITSLTRWIVCGIQDAAPSAEFDARPRGTAFQDARALPPRRVLAIPVGNGLGGAARLVLGTANSRAGVTSLGAGALAPTCAGLKRLFMAGEGSLRRASAPSDGRSGVADAGRSSHCPADPIHKVSQLALDANQRVSRSDSRVMRAHHPMTRVSGRAVPPTRRGSVRPHPRSRTLLPVSTFHKPSPTTQLGSTTQTRRAA